MCVRACVSPSLCVRVHACTVVCTDVVCTRVHMYICACVHVSLCVRACVHPVHPRVHTCDTYFPVRASCMCARACACLVCWHGSVRALGWPSTELPHRRFCAHICRTYPPPASWGLPLPAGTAQVGGCRVAETVRTLRSTQLSSHREAEGRDPRRSRHAQTQCSCGRRSCPGDGACSLKAGCVDPKGRPEM